MPPGSRAAIVNVKQNGQWINEHENVVQAYDRLYEVWNPPAPNPDFLGDLGLTVAALQGILGDAMSDNVRLRAIGGGWSLSSAAVTDGRLIDTRPMNWYFPIAPAGVVPAYPGNVSQLMYLQCGVSIDEANALLFKQTPPLALKTSGASNGQTIVGAVSTGTHGSRFQFGATPDYVVGMHIITAPDRVIWLEQASYPVISDDLASKLGVKIVRDDALFSSALVSFGSFGLVHGVLIETEPLYLLEAWRKRIPIDASLKQAMQTLTFDGVPLQYPATVPFHFEVVVNPYDTASGAYVTAMWQRAYAPGYPTPSQTPAGLGPGDNLLGFMGTLGSLLPGLVPAMVNRLVAAEYPTYGPVFGTPGEIFNSNFTLQKDMSCEIGVPMGSSARALDLMLALPELAGFPGIIAFRWVKQSKALLAFTKFATTCAIELPAAYSDSTTTYYNAVWNALDTAGIPYTLHWGQMNNFTSAGVQTMYGPARDQWVAARNQILDPAEREVFTSPFLQQCGLG